MTGYRERAPRPELRGLVSCVWSREAAQDGGAQLVVPDGCVDLIWRGTHLEIAGPDTRAWTSQLAAGERLVGIRARPGSAQLLLGAPATELRDVHGVADAPWSRVFADRIAEAPDRAGELLEEFALRRLRSWQPDRAIATAVRALDAPRPHSIAGIAELVGLSERQLRRRFLDAVGYGPSTLVGVLRFQRAVRLAGSTDAATLAVLAGYADQAHLGRDFRRLSGLTPAQYLGRRPAASAARRA